VNPRGTARPSTSTNQANLAAITVRVRRRLIRWFRHSRLLDAAATADMLTRGESRVPIDDGVRVTLIDRVVPS
jgi:hypothetical protein